MNPTFETMPLENLRAYVLSNQTDTAAFHPSSINSKPRVKESNISTPTLQKI
ncbi:DUF6887 family protein [Phormidesmis sp. 146-12]